MLCTLLFLLSMQKSIMGAALEEGSGSATGSPAETVVSDGDPISIIVYADQFAMPKSVEVLPVDDLYLVLLKLGISKDEILGSVVWRCNPETGVIEGGKSATTHLRRDGTVSLHEIKAGEAIRVDWPDFSKSTLEVVMETPSGKSVLTGIDPEESLLYCKARVEKRCQLAREQQVLEMGGSIWENDFDTLVDCDLEERDQIHVKQALFGLPFDFTDLLEGKKIKWSKSAPRWRRGAPGFNVEGICKAPDCIAKDQQVIVNLGYGKFEMGKVTSCSLCPICKGEKGRKFLKKVHSCFFVKCKFSYEGLLHPEDEDEDGEEKSGEGEHKGDEDFLYFKGEKDADEGSALTKWGYLSITVKKLDA